MAHVTTTTARVAGSVLAGALAAAAVTLIGAPAYAADADLDGITYSEIDPADPSAGAVVSAYDSADNVFHPYVVIEDEVEIDGDMHEVVEVGDEVFLSAGLETVELPATVTTIGSSAFSGNILTEIVLPEGLVTIGSEAFFGNSLEEVLLPSTVSTVGRAAFFGNDLSNVSLGAVASIGAVAFASNDLTRVYIPSTVTSMGGNVFANTSTLELVTFYGEAPSHTGGVGDNPISTNSVSPDFEVRFRVDDLDTFSWPTWFGFDAVPFAEVSFADPHLNVPVRSSGVFVQLDEGTVAPFGYLGSSYDSDFDIAAPEGYVLAGWSANGEPFEVGDPILEDTVMTPLWIDTTAVRSVVITPSAAEVDEGGSITMSAEGFNALGDSVGDVTSDMEFSSDIATDVVNGATITFPTASPHTISGLYLPLELTAEPVVVEVLAAEVDDTPGTDTAATSAPVEELAQTGFDEHRAPIVAAGALIALGAGLVALRKRIG